jgi:hypothetical protein
MAAAERLSTRWQLLKSSATVLRSSTELLTFPVLCAAGMLVVIAGFAVPLWQHSTHPGPLKYVLAFLFYLASWLVILFTHVALICAALVRLRGGTPAIAGSLRVGLRHFKAIAGHALSSATVGLFLRATQNRPGLLSRILLATLGFSWSVGTFLVLPVMIVEGLGPIAAVKRSVTLVERTWGAHATANASLATLFGLAILPVLAVGIPIIALADSPLAQIAALTSVLFALTASTILNATLNGICTAAVYLYAAEGSTHPRFEGIENAFRPKK